MTITLAQSTSRIQPSATLALNAKAAALKAQGKNIINLTVGEPDFDTPEFIKEAAVAAMKQGKTKYTPVDGIPSLKEAIIEKIAASHQLHYQKNQVVVSCGAKQAIFNLCAAIINPGDEVIIPAPYWVSYPEIVQFLGGHPVFLSSNIEQQFKVLPDQLARAITPKTKLFMLNSPSNPSGMAYSPEELKALASVLLAHPHVAVMSDDIYESILWNHTPFKNILMVCPELIDRTIIIHGVSKAYAMTGWRIGYALGPSPVIQAMATIQSQSTSNACSIAQAAAEAALRGDQRCVKAMTETFKKRHDIALNALNQIEGLNVLPCDGTFYLFPNFKSIIDRSPKINNDVMLSEWLLDQAEVATVPGSAFGSPDNLRLSFAIDDQKLLEAIARIKITIDQL